MASNWNLKFAWYALLINLGVWFFCFCGLYLEVGGTRGCYDANANKNDTKPTVLPYFLKYWFFFEN